MVPYITPCIPQTPTSLIVQEPLLVSPDMVVLDAIAQMYGAQSSADGARVGTPQPDGLSPSPCSSCVMVVDAERLIGILTERDVVRLNLQQQPLSQVVMGQVMTHPVVTLRQSDFTDPWIAVERLQQHHIRHLPIVDDQDRPVGLVTSESILAIAQAMPAALRQGEPSDRHPAPPSDELNLETLISNLPGYVYRARNDPNYTADFISDGVEAITGYHPHDYLVERSISCGQEIHPEDVSAVWDIVQLALQEHRAYECEYRIITRTGEEKWVWERGQGIYTDNGDLLFLEGFVTEITDRKQTEVALVQSEMKSRAILAVIPDLMLRIGADGVFREVVTQHRELDLIPQDIDPVGRSITELLPKDLGERQVHHIQEALQTDELQVYEQQVLVGDRWQDEEIRAIKSSDDEVLLIIRDISDRKQAERQLQTLIEGTAATTGQDFFPALVKHVAEALQVSYALISERCDDGTLNTLAFWGNGALQATFSYHPAQTPCERTLNEGRFYCKNLVQQQFPEDLDLVVMGVESYLGIALRDSQGVAIGNLCILDAEPIIGPQRLENLLRVFAARASAELERQRAITALERLNAELEDRVAQRTTQLREQEAQLQDFFDSANDLIQSVVLADGRFEYVNRAWRETLGYSKAEVETRTLFDVLHPDSQTLWRKAIAQIQGGNMDAVERVELIFLSKTHQEIMVEGSINCRMEHQRPMSIRAIFRDITERKATEKQLYDREARYRALMDGASDAILWANPSGYLLEGNRKAEELLGYTRAELMTLHFTQLHPPEELPRVTALLKELVDQKVSQVFDINFLHKGGEVVPVDISASTIEIQGEYILQGIFRDIRDRKQAESALRESEIRFRRVFDSNVVGMMFTDFSGQISDANDRFLAMIGYTREDLMAGRINWATFTPPEYRQRDLDAIDRLNHDHAVEPWEKVYYHKDGHPVFVLVGVAPLSREDGSCVGVILDITDRKRSETALRESQQFLQTVLDAFPLAVFWKDRNSVYLGCNQRFASVSGIQSPSEVVGKVDFDLSYSESEALAYRADDHQVIESGVAKLGIEETLTLPNGKQIWLETNKLPLRDVTGSVVGVIGTFQDISDRKQVEIQLQQQAQYKQLLWSITQTIRQSLRIDEILHATVTEARHLLSVDRVAIYGFRPDWGGEFIVESVAANWIRLVGADVHQVWEDTYLQETQGGRFQHGETLMVADIYQAGLQPCHVELLEQFQARAYVISPIFIGQTLWGLLAMYQNSGPYTWENREIELLQQITSQLAIAIYQANLYEQMQSELHIRQQAEATISQQLQRQQALGQIVQHIRESLDLNQILATVAQQVKEALHSDRAIVFRLFADGRSQIVEESVSAPFPALKNRHWDDEVWPQDILDLYWQGTPRIVPDVMDDVWTHCLMEYSRQGQIQSKIVAPILQDTHDSETHRWVSSQESNKLWGVLVVHACQERRVWQESEAQLLQQIANQLAIAIQQASLFERLQQELCERQQAQQQLTERNQQLAISNEELARATRLKDEFLANMSHELRTPLNAILGMTEGLQEVVFGPITPQQIKALQTIERSGSHLLELINDILDLAKIGAGQIELDCGPTAVAPLCTSSLAFIKQQALKKQIQLEIKLPPHLPHLWVDERRIRQVLINLLNNAVKFTPDGGQVTLEAQIQEIDQSLPHPGPSPATTWIQFLVTDTGIGIAPEHRDKLFQPFVQIDSALNRQYQGTGLGLALVKRIVELHGGQVGLTSTLGAGSCFTLSLPCSDDASPSVLDQALRPDFITPNPSEPGTSPLVLLAEDNDANILTISSYLTAKGYRLLLANSGQEAIALAQAHCPDLILMDIQMPGMDGLDAIQHLRQVSGFDQVPIIALTALAMTGDRERCLAVGANDYLSKPVRLRQLADTIQALLTQSDRPAEPPEETCDGDRSG